MTRSINPRTAKYKPGYYPKPPEQKPKAVVPAKVVKLREHLAKMRERS